MHFVNPVLGMHVTGTMFYIWKFSRLDKAIFVDDSRFSQSFMYKNPFSIIVALQDEGHDPGI